MRKEHKRGIVMIVITAALWAGLILLGTNAHAKADYITMDIDSSFRSGTVLCESVQKCYIKVQQMEERGANQYCNSVVIKRNGKVVWGKNYWRDPSSSKITSAYGFPYAE
jgi:hypothetical protein